MPPKVLFDTTVLLGAFLNPDPDGLCMNLLEWARLGVIEPVLTQEVVAEWSRTAKAGVGGVQYDDEDLDAFCELVEPLLSAESLHQVRLGRNRVPLFPIARAGENIRLITQHPTRGHATTETHLRNPGTLIVKDPADAHLFQVALDLGCDYLCSSNTKDLPPGLNVGGLTCITPEALMAMIRREHAPEG